MIALLLALACARRAPPEDLPPVAAPVAQPAPAPTGHIADGRYQDDRLGLSAPVPEGWRARTGRGDGALRVALEHVESGTRVEIWAFESQDETPRPRDGCAWTFVDRGRYRALKVPEATTVATCTPDDPVAPVIFAYLINRDGVLVQIEVAAPRDDLARGKQLGDALVSGVRLGP